jgi:hypothetical protein
VSDYQAILLAFLLIAGPFNLYQPRALALVFLSSVFLLFLNRFLPPPDPLGVEWFELLIKSEFIFAVMALMSSTIAGRWVAGFCVWNMAGHFFGLVAFSCDWPYYSSYSPLIRAGELCQALALILFPQPIIQFAVWFRTKNRSTDDEWHRLEHGTQ